MKRVLALFALLLPLALASCASPPAPVRPALKVTTLDGKPFDLAAQRGHWTIVNFWATWCVPCIKEMPALSQYVAAHPDVRAIGLAYEDGAPADIKAFLVKHPVAYPVAQVTLEEPPQGFAAPEGLPTTYLIAPDGTVAKHFLGPVTPDQIATAIAVGKH